ncbi:hypothetical protein COLSTE_01512 [Collinsella stercoris DSM 13279]|uniref:Uncharacterized protein n=1 Tax=Collinsella stercoris DSM 13279 TaxID=445975 RepID=B6GBP9_9ACTN|nr:hypothetical protein COLSTE_01512 [Collinsella stercoris DSM 13279]
MLSGTCRVERGVTVDVGGIRPRCDICRACYLCSRKAAHRGRWGTLLH